MFSGGQGVLAHFSDVQEIEFGRGLRTALAPLQGARNFRDDYPAARSALGCILAAFQAAFRGIPLDGDEGN